MKNKNINFKEKLNHYILFCKSTHFKNLDLLYDKNSVNNFILELNTIEHINDLHLMFLDYLNSSEAVIYLMIKSHLMNDLILEKITKNNLDNKIILNHIIESKYYNDNLKNIIEYDKFKNHGNQIFENIFKKNISELSQIAKTTNNQELIQEFYNDNRISILEMLARNPYISKDILDKLYQSNNRHILYGIAINPITDNKKLKELMIYNHYLVRSGVASNPNASEAILFKLSNDTYMEVKKEIANNKSTPFNIKKLLLLENSNDINYSMAENPDTPIDLLKLLTKNPFIKIKEKAIDTLTSIEPDEIDTILNTLSEEIIIITSKLISNDRKDYKLLELLEYKQKKYDKLIEKSNDLEMGLI